MTKKPMVSVVIPTYNRSDLLQIAISSVIAQTYRDFEIIVVDDGSTEDLQKLECLQNDKVYYYKNQNHGVAYSRNFGLKKARGKYVAFLDSDDFWDARKLEVQVKEMERAQAKWSQHSYYYFDDRNKRITSQIDTKLYEKNTAQYFFCSFKVQTSCFMVDRKTVLENNFIFDESKTFGEDNEFYLSMMKKYPLLCIKECLGYFRIKETNAGFDARKQITSRAVLWEQYKDDVFFVKNTSCRVRLAYRYCAYIVCKMSKCNSDFLYKLAYVLPWSIYKIETQLIKRKC